jgi:hypothetical protein
LCCCNLLAEFVKERKYRKLFWFESVCQLGVRKCARGISDSIVYTILLYFILFLSYIAVSFKLLFTSHFQFPQCRKHYGKALPSPVS